MATSTTKKALIRRFHRETLAGYLNPVTFLQPEGVELLSAEGQVAILPYDEVKTVSFVRDFEVPEEQERQIFHSRPKMASQTTCCNWKTTVSWWCRRIRMATGSGFSFRGRRCWP